MSIYIFGYGSLVAKASAELSLRRTIAPEDFSTCSLVSFGRYWDLVETVHANDLHKAVQAVFLNIRPAEDRTINGSLFRVSETELAVLKKREKNYACLAVTDKIRDSQIELDGEDVVYAFSCNDPRFLTVSASGEYVVMENYVHLVENAFRSVGDGFHAAYVASTQDIPYPLLSGTYLFSDPEQAKTLRPDPS